MKTACSQPAAPNSGGRHSDAPPQHAPATSTASSAASSSSTCVSVNIVQQINNSPATAVNSEIQINVHSTLHTSQCSGGTTSTSTEIKTNICKEEPKDVVSSCGATTATPGVSTAAGATSSNAFGFDDNYDELTDILDALEKEGSITSDFMLATDNSNSQPGQTDLLRPSGEQAPSKALHDSSQDSKQFSKQNSAPCAIENSHMNHSNNMYADSYDAMSRTPNAGFDSLSAGGPGQASCMGGTFVPSPAEPGTPGTGAAAVAALPPLGEPGPAAETLKQMAAQHQSNEHKMPFGAAYGADAYGDSMTRRPGYSPNFSNMSQYMSCQGASYPYSQPMPNRMPYHHNTMGGAPHMPSARAAMAMGGAHPGMQQAMQAQQSAAASHRLPCHSPDAIRPSSLPPPGAYGKPMPAGAAAYAPNGSSSGSPSSLQQLQEQVKTQFGPQSMPPGAGGGASMQPQQHMGGDMQITQSQHMRMAHPGAAAGALHMSQSQRMQFSAQHSSHGMSMAQQQSFNMSYNSSGGGGGPQSYMSEERRMKQLYEEKMRSVQQQQQQQQQQQYARTQQQQQQQPPPEYPATPSSQQQYSRNYPPPEYNAPSSAANPLQTMRAMVEQTKNANQQPSNEPARAVFPVSPATSTDANSRSKPVVESAVTSSAMMSRHSVSGGSVQSSTVVTSAVAATSASAAPTSTITQTKNSNVTAQASTPQTTNTSSISSSSSSSSMTDVKPAPEASTYTSAIMRGQRPPNVNIGPEGLNISQPRLPGWHRPMMAGGGHMSQGAGGMMTSPHHHHPAAMQQHYASTGMPAYTQQHSMGVMSHAQRMHMSQQQAMHLQRTMSAPAGHGAAHAGMSMHHQQQMMLHQQQQQQLRLQQQQQQQHNGHQQHGMQQAGMMTRTASHPHHMTSSARHYHQPHAGSANSYASEFMDHPQLTHNSSDYFDPLVQSTGGPPDFMDDIFGGK